MATRTEDSFVLALEYFERALDEDPGYALAYSGKADALGLLGHYAYMPPAAKPIDKVARRPSERSSSMKSWRRHMFRSVGLTTTSAGGVNRKRRFGEPSILTRTTERALSGTAYS